MKKTTGKTVRIGIIGAGRIGRLHADNLSSRVKNVEVAAVSDVLAEAAEQCAAACGIKSAYRDYRRIMDDRDIDAVIICSSTDTHSQMIEDAAEAGKQIFCEKPIDFDLAKIDRALGKVEQAGVKLQVGFNRRFDPNFATIHESIREGKIGTPHILRITSRDPAPPPIEYVKVSGGIFLDMTIHDFDMARFLIGSEVEEVFAVGGVMIDPKIKDVGDLDTTVITLSFSNGVIGTIDNSRQAVYGYDQRVEVFGSAGVLMAENKRPTQVRMLDKQGTRSDLPLYFFLERYTESYVREMQTFIDCVLNDQAPPVSGIDGRIPVVIGKAAGLSYKEHRPVKLSELTA
jgi:myo-inositol 2-dehydrogenase/D-chiro-inositol 1-dehydrogenase